MCHGLRLSRSEIEIWSVNNLRLDGQRVGLKLSTSLKMAIAEAIIFKN